MNTLSCCSRKASALALSEGHTRLLDTKTLGYLSCATRRRLVVVLRSRLYLVRWTDLLLCRAFLYALSRLFIRRFTEVLTQGR